MGKGIAAVWQPQTSATSVLRKPASQSISGSARSPRQCTRFSAILNDMAGLGGTREGHRASIMNEHPARPQRPIRRRALCMFWSWRRYRISGALATPGKGGWGGSRPHPRPCQCFSWMVCSLRLRYIRFVRLTPALPARGRRLYSMDIASLHAAKYRDRLPSRRSYLASAKSLGRHPVLHSAEG